MSFAVAFMSELEKLAAEASISEADMSGQQPERQEPDSSEVPRDSAPPLGDFASTDARTSLQDMMSSVEGRNKIREAYSSLRSKVDAVVGERKAFTRSLLRARREIFGPSASPRQDLRRLLYKDEPFLEVSSA